uniref:EB domain-containing protein n=1 Tax=Ditylenchus dipsaci TaxID=166011 RepID=A0A915CSS1_9BILA
MVLSKPDAMKRRTNAFIFHGISYKLTVMPRSNDRVELLENGRVKHCASHKTSLCGSGYKCERPVENPSLHVCCGRRSPRHSDDPTYRCPNSQIAYLRNGVNVFCTTLGRTDVCPPGNICTRTVAEPNIVLLPNKHPVQPGFHVNNPWSARRLCVLLDPFIHGMSFRILPSLDIYTGNQAKCLQAQNRPNVFLCCKSTEPPRVCPFGQHALLRAGGQPETCPSPGATCSNPSYTCQFSQILRTYVCCGQPGTTALCADGRETYIQEIGKTYTCNVLTYPSNCPNGVV